MKKNHFPFVLIALFVFIGSLTSCSKESLFEETNPELQQASFPLNSVDPSDGTGSCTVSGPTQYWHAWVDDMEDVLNECFTETLPTHCQYVSPPTSASITHSFEYQSNQVPAATVNLAITNIASWAQSYQNQPSGNWIVTGYSLYYQTGGLYPRVHMTASLRKIICMHQVPVK